MEIKLGPKQQRTLTIEGMDWFLLTIMVGTAWGLFRVDQIGPASLAEVYHAPLKDLLVAGFIAAFLGLTLDQYLRHHTVKDVAKGVAPYFLTFPLPAEVAHEVVAVRSVHAVRSAVILKYSFEYKDDRKERLRIRKELSYTIINYSDRPFTHHHRTKVISKRPHTVVSASATGEDLSETYGFPGKKEVFDQKTNVRPNAAAQRNRFELALEQDDEDANDTDVVTLRDLPSLDVEVRVDRKPPDLSVEVVFAHRRGEQVDRIGDSIWKLPGALLPWATIAVIWTREPTQNQSPAV